MKNKTLIVFREPGLKPDSNESARVISIQQLGEWIRTGKIIRHLFQYQKVRLLTFCYDLLPNPFFVSAAVWALSWKQCFIEDEEGGARAVTLVQLIRFFFRYLKGLFLRPGILRKEGEKIQSYLKEISNQGSPESLNFAHSSVYIRSDFNFKLSAGGSVGHTAGVINNLSHFTGPSIFFSTLEIPIIKNSIEFHKILPKNKFWDFRELPNILYNETFQKKVDEILSGKSLSLVYQRYCAFNYSGLHLANRRKVPFILEYNGSEVWIQRNWGTPLRFEDLAVKIEMLNLRGADVVVVVSEPSKDELLERGIEPEKILVNPNGVDPEMYSPEIKGSAIRDQYGLKGKIVIGFIGTFGQWHGAEVLAEAFGLLLKRDPDLEKKIHLLMIGDGLTFSKVQKTLGDFKVSSSCALTGLIPQEEGPFYLAACDIFASPHVPNPDGTPFFGSPTKLFEYMAMGKGTVASDLDQIGEVLRHNETGWLVKPGDAQALADGLKKLIDDPGLRNRLGDAARREVVEKYTWREHTRKIIEKLKERVG